MKITNCKHKETPMENGGCFSCAEDEMKVFMLKRRIRTLLNESRKTINSCQGCAKGWKVVMFGKNTFHKVPNTLDNSVGCKFPALAKACKEMERYEHNK